MKKLLLILLCVPLIGLGQTNFDLNQLKKIDSKDDFARYCIENGYEKNCDNSIEFQYARGMPPLSQRNTDCNKVTATDFAVYYKYVENNSIMFEISEMSLNWTRQRNLVSYYDNIVSDIKKECTFYEIRGISSDMISVYNCDGDLIGFLVKQDTGIILKFLE